MGIAAIKIKIMPNSLDVNLEEIKKQAKKIIEKGEGKNIIFTEEPIAFGLKAIIVFFGLDESKELEPTENNLRKIKNVSSAEVIDLRRAFG